jgi:hypothetical protein
MMTFFAKKRKKKNNQVFKELGVILVYINLRKAECKTVDKKGSGYQFHSPAGNAVSLNRYASGDIPRRQYSAGTYDR